MGQLLSKVHLDIKDNTVIDLKIVLSDDVKDNISFFFPSKTSSSSSDSTINPLELNNDPQISHLQIEYIKQIQNYLFQLTKSVQWDEMNTEINGNLICNIAS